MAIDPYSLTTLADVKLVLGITGTTYDSVLEYFIDRASKEVEQILGWNVVARDYNEIYTASDFQVSRVISLKNKPINNVYRVTSQKALGMILNYSGSDVVATVEVNSTGVSTHSEGTSGRTSNSFTFANYETIGEMVIAIGALSGWTVSLNTDGASQMLIPASYAVKPTAFVYSTTQQIGTWFLDTPKGVLHLPRSVTNSWFDGNGRIPDDWRFSNYADLTTTYGYVAPAVEVAYNAGYATIPYDISSVTTDLVATMFKSRGLNFNMQSESIGEYSYTIGKAQREWVADRLAGRIQIR